MSPSCVRGEPGQGNPPRRDAGTETARQPRPDACVARARLGREVASAGRLDLAAYWAQLGVELLRRQNTLTWRVSSAPACVRCAA